MNFEQPQQQPPQNPEGTQYGTQCYKCGAIHVYGSPQEAPAFCHNCRMEFKKIYQEPDRFISREEMMKNARTYQDDAPRQKPENPVRQEYTELDKAFLAMGLRKEILDSDPDPLSTIKKTFRDLALVNHPDKGGESRAFRVLVHANETLKEHYSK